MKKALSLALMLAMALSLCACGGGSQNQSSTGSNDSSISGSPTQTGDGEVYELQISNQLNESDPINVGWRYLEEILEERSEGRINVTIFPNKALSASVNEDLEKVQFGVVQMTSVPTSTVASLAGNSGYQVFEMPYMFQNEEEIYNVLTSDLGQSWNAEIESNMGIKLFNGYGIGWYQLSANKDLNSLADFKGLKIRVMSSDLQVALVKALGANPIIMGWGEVYTGLQQGTCDGLMTSPSFYVSDKLYEVQSNMAVVNIICGVHIPCVNAAWYDGLPEDLRAVFDSCVEDWLTYVRSVEANAEEESLEALKEANMQITVFEGSQLETVQDAAATVWDDYADVVGADNMKAVREMLGR